MGASDVATVLGPGGASAGLGGAIGSPATGDTGGVVYYGDSFARGEFEAEVLGHPTVAIGEFFNGIG